ncbi:Restriction endonuclease [Mycobacterium sp. 283mftsu]|nr:Restriction endonuclease [Mycobacterium sp. 283mftsu]
MSTLADTVDAVTKPHKVPLSPMLVQYLVGLFALKHGGGVGHNVIVGDEVADEASETRRDVDVTVSIPGGEVYHFAGYEVKHWKKSLDVSHVEALALKLKDMPSVTHRAIVCTSGYSEAAIKKAAYHGVDLYVIKEWTRPIELDFPDLAPMKGPPSEVFRASQHYLTWPQWHIHVHMCDAPEFLTIPWATPVLDAEAKPHPAYTDFREFAESMLVASTETLCLTKPMTDRLPSGFPPSSDEPAPAENPTWSHGHTFDVHQIGAYLRGPEGALHRIEAVTLQGQMSWERTPMLYLAMEKVPTGEMFTSALIGLSPVPGRMHAILFPKEGRELTIKWVTLTRNQLNSIKQLQVTLEGN